MGQQPEPIKAIGEELRRARENLGLTYDEVERSTRIRTRYLQALERGDLDSLPSPVQARGFLHNYAEFLGLDADRVMLRFADQLNDGPTHTAAPGEEPSQPPIVTVRRAAWLSSDLLIALGISLAVLIVLLWGGSRVLAAMQEDGRQPTASGFLLESTPSPTVTMTPAPSEAGAGEAAPAATPSPEGTLPAALLGGDQTVEGINVRILVEKRAWLSVVVDGEEDFRGRAKPGDILEFHGEQLIRAATGNGDGLRVVYNGQDQGRLGDVGEVVIRLWDRNGAITPTPTPSMTPSSTPVVTETPTPSVTPLP
jgi:cytoskeletal protein RodZ